MCIWRVGNFSGHMTICINILIRQLIWGECLFIETRRHSRQRRGTITVCHERSAMDTTVFDDGGATIFINYMLTTCQTCRLFKVVKHTMTKCSTAYAFYNTCWYIGYFLWTITSDHIVQRSHDTSCHSHTFVVCHVTRDIHPIIYPEFKSTSRNGRSVIPLAVAWIAI
jgi:hypothetical protein